MGEKRSAVTVQTMVISGIGGILLVVGVLLLGLSYLNHGTWGSLRDPPARVALLGVLILVGAALSHAVRGRDPE